MTTTSETTTTRAGGARVAVQRFGTFLSGMIMPNIAAFIAWGLITAMFIPDGWFGSNSPVAAWRWENSAMLGGGETPDGTSWEGLVGPMIHFLLPLLIAFTGGRMIYGVRGGVIGGVMTMGIIIGTWDTPMFLGAMLCGPLAAWIMKQVDKIWAGRIKPGFEMLVDNFSSGILGAALALAAFFWLSPVVQAIVDALGAGVQWLIDTQLIPLASIIVEPAKVLFLNNAINHGVLTPLGLDQVTEQGKSLLFLVEANPGPGAGLLLAISVFGVGIARATAPGAFIIQFFGGIHEVYFPYVLAKPFLLLAMIAGGATGVLTNVLFNSGLRGPAAPGSIFAVIIQTAPDSYLGVTLSVVLSAAVTFIVAMFILLASRKRDLAFEAEADARLASSVAQTEANKGKSSSVLSGLAATIAVSEVAGRPINKVVFACDAGMGSSAMGASVLRNKFKKAGVEADITNAAIANLTGDEDLVITQQELTDRARQKTPDAIHISVDNFMNSPKYDEVVQLVKEQREGAAR